MAGSTTATVLTDGSGIGKFTASKLFKDFVVDFLKTAAAVLAAQQIVGVPTNTQQAMVVTVAVIGALVSALYRAVLKWAES